MIKKDKVSIIIKMIMSIPKSLIFNMRIFPLRTAIKLPVLISLNTKVYSIYRGCIEFDTDKINPGMFRFGFGGTYGIQPILYKNFFEIRKPGKVIISGKSLFREGCTLRVGGGIKAWKQQQL